MDALHLLGVYIWLSCVCGSNCTIVARDALEVEHLHAHNTHYQKTAVSSPNELLLVNEVVYTCYSEVVNYPR